MPGGRDLEAAAALGDRRPGAARLEAVAQPDPREAAARAAAMRAVGAPEPPETAAERHAGPPVRGVGALRPFHRSGGDRQAKRRR